MAVYSNLKKSVSDDASSSDMVRVWDIVVRMFHWSLVILFAGAWLTSDDFVWLHKIIGYGVLILIGGRLLWGFVGGKYARFNNFIQSPKTVISYLMDMRDGRERRYLGHNPAGGVMIVALLLGLLTTGITGWLSTTDAYWGVRWVEIVHELSADGCIVLVCIHVLGVIYASYKHKENLVRSMITGLKRSM